MSVRYDDTASWYIVFVRDARVNCSNSAEREGSTTAVVVASGEAAVAVCAEVAAAGGDSPLMMV